MDPLRHRLLDFYDAYYGEYADILKRSSWGALDMPLALRPKYRLVVLIETNDGFVIRHFESPNPRNTYVLGAKNEVYQLNPPFWGTTIASYIPGLVYQPDRSFFDFQFFEEEAPGPDGAERQDAMTKVRVGQWTTEEAKTLAFEHLSPFVDIARAHEG